MMAPRNGRGSPSLVVVDREVSRAAQALNHAATLSPTAVRVTRIPDGWEHRLDQEVDRFLSCCQGAAHALAYTAEETADYLSAFMNDIADLDRAAARHAEQL